jgi:hypothetical protein
VPGRHGVLGVHDLFVNGKAIPGVSLWARSDWFGLGLEASLIFMTGSHQGHDAFLGSQLGGYLLGFPVRTERVELEGGVGIDYYPLYGIHGDEWQLALSTRIGGHLRLLPNAGLFATARAYPLATSGLELGAFRDRTRGLPVLFGAGVEWWL